MRLRAVDRAELGFTLVELVSVLVITGASATLVMSRFADSSTFDKRLASDQLLSIARTAQQVSYSRSSVDLYIQDLGTEVRVSVRIGGIEELGRTFPKSEVQLTADMSAVGGSAGTCSEISTPIALSFDSSGELSGAYPSGTYKDGFPVCLNGNTPGLCISPAGFAHLGSCV